MSLPRIQHEKHNAALPFAKKSVTYRPVTVKEYRNLLVAKESKDLEMIEQNFDQVLQDCVDSDITGITEPDKIFLFVQILSKSIDDVFDFIID